MGHLVGVGARISGMALLAALAGCRRDAAKANVDASAPSAPAAVPSAAPEPPKLGRGPWVAADRDGNSAYFGRGPGTGSGKDCKVHRPCEPLPALPPCSSSLRPIDATDFDTLYQRVDQEVAIRGPLLAQPPASTAKGCPPVPQSKLSTCCNGAGGGAAIVGKALAVTLEGFGCQGDESRQCCNAPVFGETVTAVGKLVRGWGPEWDELSLVKASLCRDSAAPEPQRAATVLDFHEAERVGKSALIDRGTKELWPKHCKIHRPCAPLSPLPACDGSLKSIDAIDFGDPPSAREGQEIAIRGPLVLTSGAMTTQGCKYLAREKLMDCCHTLGDFALVGEGPWAVSLDGFGCDGDDSRSCCNVPAFGQWVTAVGTLSRGVETRWALMKASLCREAAEAR